MLHDFLFTPFADPAAAQLYDQVVAALRADASAPVSLLLGNFAVADGGETLDAVVVRPHSITVLVLVPRGGSLEIPALGYGAWRLAGRPLTGRTAADNPYEQFGRQQHALAAWLGPQFPREQADLRLISGLVVFGAPVTFGPAVESQLAHLPDGLFQLLGAVEQLPHRLAQLARPAINLPVATLTRWAHEMGEDFAEEADATPPGPAAEAAAATPPSLWRKAWAWLGADDIADDTPYGHPAAQAAANSAEKLRLEQEQRAAQAQVQQQLQAMEAREAERERRIEELRAELAQAPPVTTETQALQERLAAESQEKAALVAAIHASRAESAARNQELDAKIQQLGQLIDQLNARATAPAPTPIAVAGTAALRPGSGGSFPPSASGSRRRAQRWRRQLPRLAAVAGVVAVLGMGAWGLSRAPAGSPAPAGSGRASAAVPPAAPTPKASGGLAQPERAVVERNGVYGVVDGAGTEVVAPAYDALSPYAGGYARVRVGDAYSFIDAQGREFADYYANARDFSEGYAAVRDNRGWHYLSGPEPENLAQIPVLFQEAYSFRQGVARVRVAEGYTYITKAYLSDPTVGTAPFGSYEQASDFENGTARVAQNGRRFRINTNAEPVD